MGIFHRAKQSEKKDSDLLKQYIDAYSEYRDERLFRTFQRKSLSYSQKDALTTIIEQRITDYQQTIRFQDFENLQKLLTQETNPIHRIAIEQLLETQQ